MASKGQEIRGSGLTLQVLELEPELLVMEAAYDASAGMPPAHYHPSQTETFSILEGRMGAVVDGSERIYETGETFDVHFFEVLFSGNATAAPPEDFKNEIRFA